MKFKVLFIPHAPNADYRKHRNIIDAGMYKLYLIVVRTQREAMEIAGRGVNTRHNIMPWIYS